jgi:hypothetical protein
MKSRKANWIGHILRRNCILKHVIEREIEATIGVTERRRRRCKQLQNDFNPLNAELNPICHLLALLGGATIVVVSRLRVKDARGYWKLKAKALDSTLRGTRLGRRYGSVVKEYRMNE